MPEKRTAEWRGGAIAAAILTPLLLAACADYSDRSTQLDWPITSGRSSATYYTVNVRPGDTLSEIAERYDVSEGSIARMNGIGDHDSIYASEKLRIPAGSRATRDAVYADATSRPSRNNPYIPAPQPRRGGYPDAQHRNVIVSNNLPPPTQRPHTSPAWYNPTPSPRPQPQQTQPSGSVVQQAAYVPGSPRFVWPVSGRVIGEYGSTDSGERNDGINIAANAGDPIRAAASGTVTYAGNQLRSYGNLLLLKHDDGYVTAYAHAQSIIVQKGDRVLKGQVIAYVGQTGDVTQPQLHFEIRNGVQPVNPKPLLIASR